MPQQKPKRLKKHTKLVIFVMLILFALSLDPKKAFDQWREVKIAEQKAQKRAYAKNRAPQKQRITWSKSYTLTAGTSWNSFYLPTSKKTYFLVYKCSQKGKIKTDTMRAKNCPIGRYTHLNGVHNVLFSRATKGTMTVYVKIGHPS